MKTTIAQFISCLSAQDIALIILLVLVGMVLLFCLSQKLLSLVPYVNSIDFKIPFLGIGVSIRPTYANMQIAHKIWVELVTRKISLPFDEENDVISEIYDSWYAAFGEIRKLISEIPAQQVRSDKNTRKLVEVSVAVLNQSLRPHLTKWQARHRAWIAQNKNAFPNDSPQELQKKFPKYVELTDDLRQVNESMVYFTNQLQKLSVGEIMVASSENHAYLSEGS
ncbi:MAG: hypothetical protein ACPGGG_03385 [Parvibaculales bacterium]